MIKDIITFIYGRMTGNNYICDLCQEKGLNYMDLGIIDYLFHKNNRGRYCQWCWNWINLKKFKCENCKTSGSIRSEHLTSIMVCTGCSNLVKLTIG